jgi:hypothetical protein
MQKKSPDSALRALLKQHDGTLLRTGENQRTELYQLIRKYFPMAQVSMDEM